MNNQIKELLAKGYSVGAIAMACGGPVGTKEYYDLLNKLEPNRPTGCPYCGEFVLGTGDCNCNDE
jgi:predicted  nucleic acid-binding Zn-ribbon protein